ncbi:hypothetical protein ONZ45_g5955 [Pleurotus djamor]|nr:hypothetical protein ONZ45_g5955 [Pleurotus djamor]
MWPTPPAIKSSNLANPHALITAPLHLQLFFSMPFNHSRRPSNYLRHQLFPTSTRSHETARTSALVASTCERKGSGNMSTLNSTPNTTIASQTQTSSTTLPSPPKPPRTLAILTPPSFSLASRPNTVTDTMRLPR